MGSVKLSVVVGVMVASCVACALPKQVRTKFETLATGARKATVMVDSSEGSGTGWYVYSNGKTSLVVTAGHVCEPGVPFEVTEYDGEKRDAKVVLDVDTEDDMCVLSVVGGAPGTLKLGTSADLTYGSRVFYVGFPAMQIAVVDGYYAGRDSRPKLAVSVWSFYGASGSAILDDDGEVVGLLVGINPQFPQQTFAVPVETVRLHVARALTGL